MSQPAAANCPVLPYAKATLNAAIDLRLALANLKRAQTICEHCTAEVCQIRNYYHTAIDTAIQEIAEEWQL